MTLHKFETEQDWLNARKKNINSTEVAALLGMSQYKTKLRLWLEKAGKIESDFEETAPTVWGKRLQTAIGQGISEDNGWKCFDLQGYYLEDLDSRLGASMDFRVICPEKGPGLLETKSTGFFDEEAGWFKDRAPMDYEFQIQSQVNLAIADKQAIGWGCIGALDGRKATRLYHRSPDTALFNMIREEVNKFWHSVKIDEAPAPDYAADADLIRKMQGEINVGQNISLTGNNRAHELVQNYNTLEDNTRGSREHIADTQARMEKIKAELHHMMGKAEVALVGDYRISARETVIDERLQNGYSFRRCDIKRINRKGSQK